MLAHYTTKKNILNTFWNNEWESAIIAIEVEKIFNKMLLLTLVIKEEELPTFDELICDRNLLQSFKVALEAQFTHAPTCTKDVVE